MLAYVTKSRYWEILDKGIMEGVPGTTMWHLKDIQDAIAYSYLKDKTDLHIAEIGAGHSRLLGPLSKRNFCYAIDEYKGSGGGPSTYPKLDGVSFVNCNIGNSKDTIPDNSYDIVFSISVLEHVPTDQLKSFFLDCRRVLKPNGLMIHLIDTYTEGLDGNNDQLWIRVQHYLQPFKDRIFSPVGEIQFSSITDLPFKTSYASNPDNIMQVWNRSFPALIEKRRIAQSCAIEMVGTKVPLE